jgi:hypothetical protein
MHTFFEKNSNYLVEETREVDQFTVEISWAYDFTQLELVFDPSESYYEELVEKLESGEWTHFMLKVAAYYDGREMASEFLGSIVAEDPADWIREDEDGQVDEMVHSVVDAARTEALNMIEILKKDFLGVDN